MGLAIAPATEVTPVATLVTLAEAKAYMGVTTSAHDTEIARLVAQAGGVVQNLAGPTPLIATFNDPVVGGLLPHYPIVSVTALDVTVVNASIGQVRTSATEVTYTAGLSSTPPPEFVDAALLFISYKYRRNHGGSESYMPAGQDSGIAPPMGVTALYQQIRLALGEHAKGATVA